MLLLFLLKLPADKSADNDLMLPLLFIFMTCYLLLFKQTIKQDVLLLIISLLASHSTFQGVFISIILIIFYLINIFILKRKNLQNVIFTLLNGVIFLGYFYRLNINATSKVLMGLPFYISNITIYLKYMIFSINNFINYKQFDVISFILPTVFVLSFFYTLFLVFVKRKMEYFIIINLYNYSLLFILAVALGRAVAFGADQALSSRYNTMVIPLYIGLYFFISKIYYSKSYNKNIAKIMLIIFSFIVFFAYIRGVKMAMYELHIYAFKKGTDAWKACFLKYEDINKCDNITGGFKIYPNAKAVQLDSKIKLLKDYRMNIYSDNL